MTDRGTESLPLCVDLDGTLLATDSLHELAIRLVAQRPADLLRLPGWTVRGRAHVKARLAERVHLDPATLAYREEVVGLVREARAGGRETVLVTAADRRTARAIAEHVGAFDDVLGSEGERNLKGTRKADVLVERFGRGGFEYLGDARADLPVWEAAGGASLVAAPERVARAAARLPLRRRLDAAPVPARLRSRAWAGALGGIRQLANLFVLVPAVVGGLGASAWPSALVAGVAFLLATAGVSLVRSLLERADGHGPETGAPSILRASLAAVGFSLAGAVLWALALPAAGLLALLAFLALGGVGALLRPASAAGRAALGGLLLLARLAGGLLALP